MPDLVDEGLERLEGGDEHVEPQVELVAVHQQRRLDVPLRDHLRSQTHHPDIQTECRPRHHRSELPDLCVKQEGCYWFVARTISL